MRVAVVGGGIAGLAAAYELSRAAGPGASVTLLEAADRLGGKIRTEELAGHRFDVGPEALLARVPWAVELCGELGLAGELVGAAESGAFLWTRGRLRPLPTGPVLGMPAGIMPVLRAGIFSPRGVARASLDLLLPASRPPEDEAVGALVRRRLGREVVERFVDPLLGGIYAGDCDHLSVHATAPQLAALAREHRSLVLGVRAASAASRPADGPVFVTLPGGLGRLVERLRDELDGVELRAGTAVHALEPVPGGRWRLLLSGDGAIEADAVVLAVPAPAAAELVRQVSPEAAGDLGAIEYADVTVVSLAYPAGAVPAPLRGSGFLVPRSEGRLITGCTWSSAKWAHLDDGARLLLRCSVGERGAALDDAALVERACSELREAMGLRGEPAEAIVTRWDGAIPQYAPGHFDRVDRIAEALRGVPPLELAGAAYRGVGVPACIAQGRSAGGRVLARLGAARLPEPERTTR